MRQNKGGDKNTLLLFMLAISTMAHAAVLLVNSYTPPIAVVQEGDSPPVRIVIQSAPESDLSKRSPQTTKKNVYTEQHLDLPEMLTNRRFMANVVTDETGVTGDQAPDATVPQTHYSPSSVKPHHIAAAKRKIDKRVQKQSHPLEREQQNGELAAAGSGKHPTGTESSIAGGEAMERYLQTIRNKIEKNKNYPMRARTLRLQGGAMVAFLVHADGQIEGLDIRQSSGHGVLDRAALQAVTRAAPFPPHPSIVQQSVLPLEVVLSFRLER